jgi:hypothetical protein
MRLSKRITSQILSTRLKNWEGLLGKMEDTILSFAYGRKALLETGRPWQAILKGQVLL